ncbi:MAG: CDP-6-deoxy-delta-3,4-glucoseen reductase [Pseudomonadota bacterium]
MNFSVHLQRSGRQFDASPAESVLDAAMRHGILIPYGCRNGACGSCRGKILEGQIDYPAGEPGGLDGRQRARGEALLCQAHAASDLKLDVEELDAGQVAEVRTLPVRVMELEKLAHDVMRMGLKLPATERLRYLPGQYIEIILRDGRRRAFSLANPPQADELLELHIRHVPGGAFSGHVFDGLKVRALMRIHGPLGSFFLRDEPRPAILVAGGTGFAPMQALIEGAIAAADKRELHLYWGVRSARDLYRDERARRWAAQHSQVRYVPVLSDPDGEDWNGRTGFVHEAVLEDFEDLSGHDVYASGPPVMINAVRGHFVDVGLDLDHLYYDSFDYAYETGYDA